MTPWYQDQSATLYHGNSLDVLRTLPDCSVQCCVTSPPYYALRDYGTDGQLGLEKTPEEYVANLVAIFGEVRRILRDDGTLFLNIGDSYAAGGKLGPNRQGNHSTLQGAKDYQNNGRGSQLPAGLHESHRQAGAVGRAWQKPPAGLKCKDLMGIPWMVAFALRADGWYLRSEIIWAKRSPMPESVTDRPTKAHEQIFLFSKSKRYFWDTVGSQERAAAGNRGSGFTSGKTAHQKHNLGMGPREDSATRNMRSVWSLSSYPLKAAHFAAFPPELVRRCLSAGVSPHGACAVCGAPWARIVEKRRVPTRSGENSKVNGIVLDLESPYQNHAGDICGNRDPKRHCTENITTGWQLTCKCDWDEFNENLRPVPCTVLDPFNGAGTTWKTCQRLGLHYVGIDLNADYLQLSVDRPAVTFPYERKKSKPRRIRKIITPMLEGLE